MILSANCIEGERVRLREPHNEDADGLLETQTDERVRRYLGGPRPERNLGAAMLSAGCYLVAEKESDEMLGLLVLGRRDPELPGHVQDGGNELELSYVFRHHVWGQGYATEAARALLRCAAAELPDQPVVIVTQTVNRASLRLAQRLGFSNVRTFQQYNAEQTLATTRLASFAG